MTERRSRGDGALYWSESRQRWIAEVTVGFSPNGKRITRKRSGKTKTDAKNELKELIRDLDDGHAIAPGDYTVADAIRDWFSSGLRRANEETVKNYKFLADGHIIPHLGRRKLRQLSADDVDRWLETVAKQVSTRTIRLLRSLLERAVTHAQKRDKVKRNVVKLCEAPEGLPGRPSKSLTLEQAEAVLNASEESSIHAYVVLSILIGARTEELRALTWDHVDLFGDPTEDPPVPRSIAVWHSVRSGRDTKTRKSRRTLALPHRCAIALRLHRLRQKEAYRKAGKEWREDGLVFASQAGTELDSHNVRRAFRRVIKAAGLPPKEWTPREMRHSFVSLLSSHRVPLEDIARLCGHSGSTVTETVYRHQILPVLEDGAKVMDDIFARRKRAA